MKIKNIFITLGVCAAMGFGAFAGIKASRGEIKEARATKVTDSSIEIRFSRPNEDGWTSHGVSLHTYESGGTPTTEWPGYDMTFAYNNESGQSVYTWHPSESEPLYGKIIFNNQNNGKQTAEVDAPTSSTGFYKNGNSVGTYNLESTYYLYDYDNAFNGAPHAYAWNANNNTIKNETWPASANMTAMTSLTGNGRVYSISLDVKYNQIQFNNGTNAKQVDAGQPTAAYAYVYAPDSELDGESTWWSNINYVYAHNWAMNLLNFRNISAEAGAGADGSDCESLYGTAKTVYNYFKTNFNYVLPEIANNFSSALTRMSAWAEHHHESFVVSEGVGTFSTNAYLTPYIENKNNSTLVIILVSTISLLGLAGFFFIKRKKESK